MLYDKNYKDVREAVALSLCGSDVTELQTILNVWWGWQCNYVYLSLLQTSDNSLVFTLTLYQQITVQAKQITDKVKYFFVISMYLCELLVHGLSDCSYSKLCHS